MFCLYSDLWWVCQDAWTWVVGRKEPPNARVIGLVLAITEMYLIIFAVISVSWAFTSSPFSSLIPSLKLPLSYFAVWHWKGGGIGWRSRWWVEGTGSTARSFAMPFMMTGSMMLLIVQRREQLPRMLIIQLLPIWYFSSSLISNRVSQQKFPTAFWLLKGPFLRNSIWNCENEKSWGFKESIQLPHWRVTNWVIILGLRKIQALEETLVQQLQWKNYLELFLKWT